MWSGDVPSDSAAILFVTRGKKKKKINWFEFEVMCD